MALSRSQAYKIALIILSISISISLILFRGTIDGFAPKHIARIAETISYGGLIEPIGQIIQVPAFYTFGAQISLICDFSPEVLLSLPVQLIPHAIILFSLLYKVSGSPIISSTLASIDVCSGITGTAKIFFWPHGLGNILLFSIIILIILLLNSERTSRSSLFLCLSASSISLVYLSYNMTAIVLLLLLITIVLITVLQKTPKNNHHLSHQASTRTLFTSFLIMSIATLALSKFVYGVFIPTMDAAQGFEITSLDKFIISYLSPDVSTIPLSPIMVSYDASISIISGLKYALLAVTVLIFCALYIYWVKNNKVLSNVSLIILAFIMTISIYFILRTMIGGIAITLIWLPGLLCIAYLSGKSKRLMRWTSVVIIIVIICTISYYVAMDDGNLIDQDEYQFSSYRVPVKWYLESSDGDLAVSDEFTKNFYILYTLEYLMQDDQGISYDGVSNQFKIMPIEDVLSLVQLSNDALDSKYYIINNKLSRMSLNNWIIIQSWSYSSGAIESNHQINKIYSAPQLSIYYP